MNSNQVRYVAIAAYFVVGALSIFKVITSEQATQLGLLALAAKEFGVTFTTPTTNSKTPDNLPTK